MTYRALAKIADEISREAFGDICTHDDCTAGKPTPVLLEDSTMSLQLGLYQSATAFERQLDAMHGDLAAAFGVQVGTDKAGTPSLTVAAKGTS